MTSDQSGRLRFQLLGEVAGWRGQVRLEFGSAHRRTVLAILALSPDNVVSREELVDALWGDNPPASASGSIYTYVSSLRHVLGDKRSGKSGHGLLESVGSGYSLRVPHACVDVYRFDALRADAQRAFDGGDPAVALDALDEALALWHGGAALAGLTGPFAEAQRTRLGELRLATMEQRAEIGLAAGRHAEVAADLASLTKEHPLRETLRGLLMRALYACGRRAEALAVYADLSETLVSMSGTEPGPALTKLFDELVASDPTPSHTDTSPAAPPVPESPRRRPVRTTFFVGRDDTLETLRAAVARVAAGHGSALLLQGEAGIGKSALLAQVFAARTALGCRTMWGAADELDQLSPLRLITDCLGTAGPAGRLVTAVSDIGEAALGEVAPIVRELCADGPLIVVADDLQWADRASLLAWRHLIRLTEELPLLLVGAGRQSPARADLEQVRLDLAVRGEPVLTVGPLADSAVHTLVEHIAGAPPGRELRQLAARAAGNPCYVTELVTELVDLGQVVVDGTEAYLADTAGSALPTAVAVRVADHLACLSTATQDAVRWAALLGHEFTVTDLAAAVQRPVADLADAVDEALLAGFLIETGEWLSFRHPLVRLVLYDRTPASTRVVLHRQLAELLSVSGTSMVRVAEQLTSAKVPVDAWVSDWLSENVAPIATESPHLAVELLQHAVSQTSLRGPQRERLTATLARVLFFLGQEPTAESRLVLDGTCDSDLAAEMRWILAYVHFRRGHRVEAAEEVRRTLADRDVSDVWVGRHMRLRETLDRGDHTMPVLAVTRLLDVDLFSEDLAAALPVARRMAPSHAIPGEIHLAGAVHCYWVGRWQEAAREIRTVLRGCPDTSSYLLRTPGAVLLVNGLAATIAGHRGDVEHARGYLRTATQHSFPQSTNADFDPDAAGFLMAATALLAEQEGRPEHALDALTPILDPYYPPPVRHQWLAQLARLAMRTGDRERALHALHAVQVVDNGNGIGESTAVAAHCRGLVTESPDQILAAAAYFRTTDRVLQLGRTLEDAAGLLAEQGRLDEARVSFRTALVAYTRMGAGWDVRRAENRMRPFGIRRANIEQSSTESLNS